MASSPLLDQVRAVARLRQLSLLNQLAGVHRLMAQLLYGSGLRLMECARLRVKDLDFAYHQLTVRDGKGEKDRVTILPQLLVAPLQAQLRAARHLHAADLELGYGAVYLPHALAQVSQRGQRLALAVCLPGRAAHQ